MKIFARILFVIAFTAVCHTVLPQSRPVFKNAIKGTVVDAMSKEPIVAANVYISNTTWGSSTDSDGYFVIRSIPPGIHELVVTIVGYQFESEMVLVKDTGEVEQDFSLKPIIYETEPTEVVGEIPKEWLDNLELFKRYFLGRSGFADDCTIDNAEIIEFKKPSSKVLSASADFPLIIDNFALGFTIRTILMNFTLDRVLNKWEWSVKPAFTEMKTDDPVQRKIWNMNRQEAFAGSREHFLLSLINRDLEEEGFTAYEVAFPGDRSAQRESLHAVVPYDEMIRNGPKADEYVLLFKSYLCVIHSFSKISWIRLNYPEVTVDGTGEPQQLNAFEVYGYWAEFGLADALPQNYSSQP